MIVDLGGGVGLFSDYIKQNYKNSQSYNVDLIPPNDLEKSKYKKTIEGSSEVVIGDVHAIPLESNSVDIVHSGYLFNGAYKIDEEQIFREVCRILKKNGLFIVQDCSVRFEVKKGKKIHGLECTLIYDKIGGIEKYVFKK